MTILTDFAKEAAVEPSKSMFPKGDPLSEALREVFAAGFERGYRQHAFEELRRIDDELDLN